MTKEVLIQQISNIKQKAKSQAQFELYEKLFVAEVEDITGALLFGLDEVFEEIKESLSKIRRILHG